MSSLVVGDQRESKVRGGQVFFSSWRPKRIDEERRKSLLQQLETKRIKEEGEYKSSLIAGDKQNGRGGEDRSSFSRRLTLSLFSTISGGYLLFARDIKNESQTDYETDR